MGIRYYAYAFDGELTDQVLAHPAAFLSDDPLADAWGLVRGWGVSYATFEQSVPERDLLYLDKAWRELQAFTAPATSQARARPAYRMFEDEVASHGWCWEPWVRALAPDEIPDIARDLDELVGAAASRCQGSGVIGMGGDDEVAYLGQFLRRAHAFVSNLAVEGRGMVYMIG